MRISDWSSDVCSSDLPPLQGEGWVGMGFPTAQASGKRGANAMEAQGNTRIRKEQRQRKLRRNPTDTERELWQSLRGKQLDGAKFRRQHPFGDYILDFACIERKLVVELDGGQHAESTKYDDWRTRQLEQAGFAVLRFWNHEVFENREGVLEVILAALRDRARPIPTQPSPRRGGLQTRDTPV